MIAATALPADQAGMLLAAHEAGREEMLSDVVRYLMSARLIIGHFDKQHPSSVEELVQDLKRNFGIGY